MVVIALGAFLYFRFDEEAQRLSERILNKHCGPFTARVASASYTPGRGVTIRGVEIVEPIPWRAPRGVMQIDEVVIEGDFNLASLLRGKPTIRRVVIKSPRLAATRRGDGAWNLADFKPPPPNGAPTPRIEVRDATLLLLDEQDPAARLALHHLGAEVQPTTDGSGDLMFRLTARDTLARSADATGRVAKDGGDLSVDYQLEGLAINDKLLATLRAFKMLRVPTPPVRGVVAATGSVAQPRGRPPQWKAAFRVDSGEYRLAGAKRPLSDISLAGSADNATLRIDRGSARWGDTPIALAASRNGWGLFSPMAVRLRADDYDLASTPVDLLPEDQRILWRRFRPRGRANVAVDVTFNGMRFTPRATITALGASFEDGERFPYRLTNATGEMRVNGGVSDNPPPHDAAAGSTLDVDFRGEADGAPVNVTARFHGLKRRRPGQPRPKMPLGWVEISGAGIPISDRLVNAVPERGAKDFIHALHPAGKIDVRWRAERKDPQVTKPLLALDMRLVDCRMIYDRFPYPLSGVTGWVRQRGDDWRFDELRSRDPRGRTVVEGRGTLEPRGGSCGFELTLTGAGTPLNQTLYDALPSEAQQGWALVRPSGQIDFEATVTRRCGEPAPRVRLKMSPHERDLTIAPPLSESGHRYRLERVDGEFEWADQRLTMRNARAEHARTHYAADGSWEALGGGAWKLELVGLNADRLDFDREFLLAAPPGLSSAIESLQPRGGFDLFDSRIEVMQKVGEAGPVEARWKVNLNCHQVAIDAGVPLDGISGVIGIGGTSDGAAGVVAGELDLDSVFWNDLQMTQVRGPFWADATDLFLGEGVAQQYAAAEKRPVTAKAYDGDIQLNSWVRYGGQTRYGLAVGMAGVDVTRLSSEWLQRPETLDGALEGKLEIQGAGSSIYGLTGSGEMAVSDADLYELPLFLSLLKYLRNRTPSNTAFDRLETKFTIEGNDLDFEQFDLLGDAVNLYGKGTATLERDVDLTFASVIGRSQFSVPVLKAFVSSASEQLLRLRVVGPLDAPEVRREVLPMVGNVLEQLQTEFGGRVTERRAALGGTPATRR